MFGINNNPLMAYASCLSRLTCSWKLLNLSILFGKCGNEWFFLKNPWRLQPQRAETYVTHQRVHMAYVSCPMRPTCSWQVHYKRFDYPWWSNIVTENMGFHHRSAIVTFLLRHEDRHGMTVTECHLWRSYENRHRMKHICDDLLTVIEVDLVTLSLSS